MYEFSFGGEAHHYAKRIADSAKGFLLNHSVLRGEAEKAWPSIHPSRHVSAAVLGVGEGNSWPYFTRVLHSQLIAARAAVELGLLDFVGIWPANPPNSLLLLRLTAANPWRP